MDQHHQTPGGAPLAPTARIHLPQGRALPAEVGDAGGGTSGTARVRAGPAPGYNFIAGAAVLPSVSEPGVRGRHVPASAHFPSTYSKSIGPAPVRCKTSHPLTCPARFV